MIQYALTAVYRDLGTRELDEVVKRRGKGKAEPNWTTCHNWIYVTDYRKSTGFLQSQLRVHSFGAQYSGYSYSVFGMNGISFHSFCYRKQNERNDIPFIPKTE